MIQYILDARYQRTQGPSLGITRLEWEQLKQEHRIVFPFKEIVPHTRVRQGLIPVHIVESMEVFNDF
jgi:hypothetical protein